MKRPLTLIYGIAIIGHHFDWGGVNKNREEKYGKNCAKLA